MTDEVRNSFGLGSSESESYNQLGFQMIVDRQLQPGSDCLFDHFDRFDLSMDKGETLCYFLDEEKSYDDAYDACAYHKYHAQMHFTQKTNFRLAEGKTHSKTTICL